VKRPTFTIASLMVAVLFIAVGCMALRGPTPLMASVVFSLAVAILAGAVLLACVRTGRSRAGWAGMAAFGLAYLHFGFVGGDPGYPAFITTAGYGWLADRFTGTSTTQIHRSFGETFETSATSFVSRAVSTGFNRYAFGQVAHSLAAILFGLAGAGVGRLVAGRNGAAGS
jgi:hypothetical protein